MEYDPERVGCVLRSLTQRQWGQEGTVARGDSMTQRTPCGRRGLYGFAHQDLSSVASCGRPFVPDGPPPLRYGRTVKTAIIIR